MDEVVRQAWQAARPGGDHLIRTACVAPWVSMEFDPAGWVLACCAGHMYPLGRVGDEPLAEIWGGPRSLALRNALERWDLTVACVACRYHLERERLDPVAAVYDVHRVTQSAPPLPVTMQFALGNRCNLGCVMCNPELSSRLRTDAGLAPIEARYDDNFFAEIRPMLADLQLAKFQGGEPFLIPEHRRVWELLAELPTPPRLLVTTNGTVWTDTAEWVLRTFEVDVSISVDAATAATYESVRVGGKFSTLMTNIERFDGLARARGRRIHVSYCLMDRNWHELGAFLSWAERFEVPASVNLVTDEGLALHDLPTDQLRAVASSWRQEDAGRTFGINASVWATQLAQLDAVLRSRPHELGRVPVQPRQVEDRRSHWALAGECSPGAVAIEAAHLRDWCGGGSVAAITVDPTGRITAVGPPCRRLGIDSSLVGSLVSCLVDHIAATDGRPCWLIDEEESEGRRVRVLALSRTGGRGHPGTVVRIVQLGASAGTSTILVAEDRIQERTPVPVKLARRRGASPISGGQSTGATR